MIALSTGTLYSYGTARAVEMAARAGFDGFEVIVDSRLDTQQPAYLRRLVESYHIPLLVIHSPFLPNVPGWPGDQLGRLQKTVQLAQELGVGTVVTHLPFRFRAVQGRWRGPRCNRTFRFLVPLPYRGAYYRFLCNGVEELERTSGVTIAVENMPRTRFVGWAVNFYWLNTVDQLARLPHLTLDTTHLGTWGLDPVAVYDRLREKIAHVHLSNFDGREHRSPLDGHLALDAFLRRLGDDRYRGVITVEAQPGAFDAHDEMACLAALRRTLAFCREHFTVPASQPPGNESTPRSM